MNVSSRTPEGEPNHCPVCGTDLRIEASDPAYDAPCPNCGYLLWFTPDDSGDVVSIRLTGPFLRSEELDGLIGGIETRREVRLILDFRNVQYMSSDALGKLINLKKRLLLARGRLKIENLHPDFVEIFRITRLDQHFDIGS